MYNRLRYYLHLYFILISQDIKSKMSYPVDFGISFIALFITNITTFLFFKIIFWNFDSIVGWEYNKLLFLYGFSLLSITPAQCLLDNCWTLGDNVLNGQFIKYCTKPLNMYFYYNAEVFDLKGVGHFIIGLSTLVYSWNKLDISASFVNIFMVVLMILSSSLFMMALLNVTSSLSFRYIVGSEFIMSFVFKLGDYARYPMNIFSPVIKAFFSLVLPIGFIAYYPSLFFITPDNVPILSYITPLFGIVFFYLSYRLWISGALKYSGTGS